MNWIVKFFNFFSPLICTKDNKLSISRFWLTFLLCFAVGDFWWFAKELPASLAQVIMILLTYMLGKNVVVNSKDAFNNWSQIKWKSTEKVEQYKADASKAAKCDDV